MVQTVTVGLASRGEDVALAFQRNASVHLDSGLSEGDLVTLVERHQKEVHGAALAQLAVLHRAAGGATCARIIELYGHDTGVANAVATSGRASRSQLRALLKHRSASVRHHADLALFRLELEAATEERMTELLEENSGDGEVCTARRFMLASFKGTPARVLKALAQDDEGCIAAAAQKTMHGTQ